MQFLKRVWICRTRLERVTLVTGELRGIARRGENVEDESGKWFMAGQGTEERSRGRWSVDFAMGEHGGKRKNPATAFHRLFFRNAHAEVRVYHHCFAPSVFFSSIRRSRARVVCSFFLHFFLSFFLFFFWVFSREFVESLALG